VLTGQVTTNSSDLIDAARSGSSEAQADLFGRHWREAWRTARAICGDDHRAEDIAQDALIRALAQLGKYDARRPFGAWLRRIVVNQALNSIRKDRRLTGLDDAALLAADAEGNWEPGLAAAVRDLPVDRRVVVTLRYGLDLTPAEIADAMDLPVGTVHSRLARALGDLRQRLEVTDVH
jgi:RNA polymerase sigma-70 factor, ECF subfamily